MSQDERASYDKSHHHPRFDYQHQLPETRNKAISNNNSKHMSSQDRPQSRHSYEPDHNNNRVARGPVQQHHTATHLVSNNSSHPANLTPPPQTVFRRSSKITCLQQEFQQLKKKIKQVENKNQRIIQKIQTNKGIIPLRKAPASCKQPESADSPPHNNRSHQEEDNHDYEFDEYQFRSNNLPPHPSMGRQANRSRVVDKQHSETQKKIMDRQISHKQQSISPKKGVSSVMKPTFGDDQQQEYGSGSRVIKRQQAPHHSMSQHNYRDSVPASLSKHKIQHDQDRDQQGAGQQRHTLIRALERQKLSKQRMQLQLSQKDEINQQWQAKYEALRTNFRNYSECIKLVVQNQLDAYLEDQKKQLSSIFQKVNKNRDRLDGLCHRVNWITNRNARPRPSETSSSAFSKKKAAESVVVQWSKPKDNKDLQGLVSKYDQLIKTKNEESESWALKCKAKERELIEIKLQLDKVKDSRKKLELESEERILKLEAKLRQVTETHRRQAADFQRMQTKPPRPSLHNNNSGVESVGSNNNNSNNAQLQEFLFASNRQLNELLVKSNSAERALAEKTRQVANLEKEVASYKSMKIQMLKQYQEAIQKTKSLCREKLEEANYAAQQAKRTLNDRNSKIMVLEQSLRRIQATEAEQRLELSVLQEKYRLKDELWARKIKDDQTSQKQDLIILDLQATVSGLKSQIQKLQSNQAEHQELLKKKDRLLEDYEVDNNQLRSEVDLLKNSAEPSPRLTKEQSVMQESLLGKKESDLLKSRLGLASEQNNLLATKINSLEEQVKSLKQTNNQSTNRIRQLKTMAQKTQSDLREAEIQLDDRAKEIQVLRAKNSRELDALSQELKALEDQFSSTLRTLTDTTDKLSTKSQENRALQAQLQMLKSRYSDYETIRTQNEKLQLKLADIQEQLMAKSTKTTKMTEEHSSKVNSLKHEFESVMFDKVRLQEENKFMKHKIQELEMDALAKNLPEDSKSDIQSDTQGNKRESDLEAAQSKDNAIYDKMKSLEEKIVSLEVAKAQQDLQFRKLEASLEQVVLQKNQANKALEERNTEFAKMMMNYDEKLHEQEELIKQLQRAKNDEQLNRMMLQTRKSDIRSQSSLMFSATSQLYNYNDPMNLKSRITNSADRQIDFHLSEEGSELEEPNVQQVFQQLDYPYEKIRLRRKDQIQFLSKTAEYINNLKKTINDKNRKIRSLEKRLQAAKNGGGGSTNATNTLEDWEEQDEELSDFKDNYSVKLDERRCAKGRGDQRRKLRQLENETHLVMEENNLLLQKVNSLQEELSHAEEQENGLIRMKQIYKEEIVKLRKTLEEKEQTHRTQIERLTHLIEESEGCHNSNTLKQLTAKIFNIIFNEEKRDDKRKELEEYVKVLVSILKIENPIKHDTRHPRKSFG